MLAKSSMDIRFGIISTITTILCFMKFCFIFFLIISGPFDEKENEAKLHETKDICNCRYNAKAVLASKFL